MSNWLRIQINVKRNSFQRFLFDGRYLSHIHDFTNQKKKKKKKNPGIWLWLDLVLTERRFFTLVFSGCLALF